MSGGLCPPITLHTMVTECKLLHVLAVKSCYMKRERRPKVESNKRRWLIREEPVLYASPIKDCIASFVQIRTQLLVLLKFYAKLKYVRPTFVEFLYVSDIQNHLEDFAVTTSYSEIQNF